jgi:hypothetical protein
MNKLIITVLLFIAPLLASAQFTIGVRPYERIGIYAKKDRTTLELSYVRTWSYSVGVAYDVYRKDKVSFFVGGGYEKLIRHRQFAQIGFSTLLLDHVDIRFNISATIGTGYKKVADSYGIGFGYRF